jgi:hypothetical protein
MRANTFFFMHGRFLRGVGIGEKGMEGTPNYRLYVKLVKLGIIVLAGG